MMHIWGSRKTWLNVIKSSKNSNLKISIQQVFNKQGRKVSFCNFDTHLQKINMIILDRYLEPQDTQYMRNSNVVFTFKRQSVPNIIIFGLKRYLVKSGL